MSENEAHNKQGSKDYRDFVISKIEQSQLENTAHNNVDVYSEARDNAGMKEPTFAKLDDPTIGTKGESEFPKYPETERFAKQDLSIDEDYIRKNKGMAKLNQKTDAVADAGNSDIY